MAHGTPATGLYPHIGEQSYLQVLGTYGLLKSRQGIEPIRVSKEAALLLAACDGRSSMEEIISRHFDSGASSSDESFCEALITINKLIGQGVVVFEENPRSFGVETFRSEELHYPEAMHVELTTTCNLHCFFCYRNAGPARDEGGLPTDQLLGILSKLHDRGLRAVELTGGEPLLHPDFGRIVEFCGRTFPITSILTNGTMIDDSLVQGIAMLKDSIVVGVSLESHRPEEHDRRCGVKGSFGKATAAIATLAGFGMKTRVAMAVDAANWDDVEPALLLSRKLGATAFTYSAILPFGRAGNEPRLWDLDAKEVWQRERYLNETYGDFIQTLDVNRKQQLTQPGSCGAGHRAFAMDPMANVRLCVTMDSSMGVIGSLATQTPEEVFSHPLTKLSAVVEAPRPEVCGACKFAYFCHNCLLRGLMAHRSLGAGKCAWMVNPTVSRWAQIVLR